jgi:hypothetical protein
MPRPVQLKLITSRFGPKGERIESDVGIPVVEPIRTGAPCDDRKDDDAEAADEAG